MTSRDLDSTLRAAEIEALHAIRKYARMVVEQEVAEAVKARLDQHDDLGEKPTRWIYFIQGKDGGPVKIGVANDPKKRLADLQRTSPVDLVIIGARPGDTFVERELHERFADFRLHGEWFEASPVILAEVTAWSTEAAA